MKKWFGIASLVLAAAAFAASRPERIRVARAYPCAFINSPFTCALKSGGQCTWQSGQCVPAN